MEPAISHALDFFLFKTLRRLFKFRIDLGQTLKIEPSDEKLTWASLVLLEESHGGPCLGYLSPFNLPTSTLRLLHHIWTSFFMQPGSPLHSHLLSNKSRILQSFLTWSDRVAHQGGYTSLGFILVPYYPTFLQ